MESRDARKFLGKKIENFSKTQDIEDFVREVWESFIEKCGIGYTVNSQYNILPNFTYGKFNPSYKKVFEICLPILHTPQFYIRLSRSLGVFYIGSRL
jgi:hypothetical protein